MTLLRISSYFVCWQYLYKIRQMSLVQKTKCTDRKKLYLYTPHQLKLLINHAQASYKNISRTSYGITHQVYIDNISNTTFHGYVIPLYLRTHPSKPRLGRMDIHYVIFRVSSTCRYLPVHFNHLISLKEEV